jgi:hypothetical protein
MSTRQILVGILVLVAAAVGAYWFFANFERVTVTERTGFRGEARLNPWLAAQRLLEQMGRQASTVRSLPDLRVLPPDALLILPAWRHTLSQPLQAAVLAWVRAGGRLIVEAEIPQEPDPLLDALQVQRTEAPEADARKQASEPVEVSLPDAPHFSHVRFDSSTRLHAAAARYRIDAGSGTLLLGLQHGKGLVTVVSDLDFANNYEIGDEQHAQFFWHLASIPPGIGPVFFFNNPGRLSLWDWLLDNAWAPLAAAALLLVLWLWRTVPRLGPVAPDPERSRRRLLDHLRASGRFLWSSGGAQRMLDAAREACLRRIGRAHPDFLATPESERPRRLAELLGWPEARAREVLEPAQPKKMLEFLQTIGLYQAVHEQLALKAGAPPGKKR